MPLSCMRKLILLLLAAVGAPVLFGQNAPESLADTLVEIHIFEGIQYYKRELILFRSDGTFQDIVNDGVYTNAPNLPFVSNAPLNGTYTYAVTAGTPNQGTITFTGGASRPPFIFGAAIDGMFGPSVAIYPWIAITGALNVSNNSWVSSAHPTTPGFVIQGSSPRWVLLRGDGPSLAQFGVSSPVAAPVMSLFVVPLSGYNLGAPDYTLSPGPSLNIKSWSSDPNLTAGFQAIFSLVGAFSYPGNSNDCAALVLLPPGA
jgi:hypothetical protein